VVQGAAFPIQQSPKRVEWARVSEGERAAGEGIGGVARFDATLTPVCRRLGWMVTENAS
jgi:hypothetical protein